MTHREFSAAPALLLILALLMAGVASAASIIENANRIGMVVSPQPNTGQFTIASMKIVDPNGNQQSIPNPMPANQVFILTKVTYNFTASDTQLNSKVTLNVGDYYRMGATLSSGFCTGNDSIAPGIPIVNLGPNVYLNLNSDSQKYPITGKLNLRLMGYIGDIN